MSLCEWLRLRHEIALARKTLRQSDKLYRESAKAVEKADATGQRVKDFIARTEGENKADRPWEKK
jgi:hypothetical protein